MKASIASSAMTDNESLVAALASSNFRFTETGSEIVVHACSSVVVMSVMKTNIALFSLVSIETQ